MAQALQEAIRLKATQITEIHTVGPIALETFRTDGDVSINEFYGGNPLALLFDHRHISPVHTLAVMESLHQRSEETTMTNVIHELYMAGHYTLLATRSFQRREEALDD